MKILTIVGCIECLYRQKVYGGYYCRKEKRHFDDIMYDAPEWCPLEDYKPETGEPK